MAITKEKKQDIVAKLKSILDDAVSVVFVHFKGLSVGDTSAMRKSLRDEGVGYYVAKKTLIERALTDAGYTGAMPDVPGEMALAWSSEDPTSAARGIHEHGKKHKDALAIMGGVFEGGFLSAPEMKTIATIPPVPVLRGMFVNVINSPIQSMAILLNAVAEKKGA